MLSPTVLKVPHCTDVIPPCTEYPPQYLILHCSEQPPQYWRYPPQYSSYLPHVLLLCPSQYWRYPPTVLKVPSKVLSIPQYWCYPLHVLRLSPTVLKLSSTVLSKLYSTEAIPHSTDVIPPMYWTTSNVLKASTVLNWRYMEWNLNLPQQIEFAAVNLNLPWWILIYRDSCGPP